MKKLMFYCQHVLGMGHFIRSMALVEGLSQSFEVCFLNGGELIDGFALAKGVALVNLPPLHSDENFSRLETQSDESIELIQEKRKALLLETYDDFQPDIVIIELFPFGRKQFAVELLPLLARCRLSGKTKVFCSLRDILVKKRDQEKFEARARRILNHYFDALLIHADPQFQRLEESFSSFDQITIPIYYTGYVNQAEKQDLTEALIPLDASKPLLLASIGGGRVGVELLETSIEASILLAPDFEHQLLIFTGPYLPEEDFARLTKLAKDHPQVLLNRYTARFMDYMKQASLSISMAGYNTCMNLLSSKTPSLVLPFSGGANDEQTTRARKLEALGILGILEPQALEPDLLAGRIRRQMLAEPANTTLDLLGAQHTRGLLENIGAFKTMDALETIGAAQTIGDTIAQTLQMLMEESLRPALLKHFAAKPKPVTVFLRDDDCDEDEVMLRTLLDICLSRGVPVHAAIIPAALTKDGAFLLSEVKRFHPELLELGQHGWQHSNHESQGRKCEFGPSRNVYEQYEDIARGKALLETTFEQPFSTFTPPWNRCTEATFQALEQLGFTILAKDKAEPLPHNHKLTTIPMTLDLYCWKEGARMKAPEEIIADFIKQLGSDEPIGLLLHHKVMNDFAFSFLDTFLAELRRHQAIHFTNLQNLAAHQSTTASLSGVA